ncbi:complex I subunit 5 family protein [Terriglobus aquaticus]|uniref:Complex I subunit 5 family protein n=1 Tax=Terriglobus aquaticus TaxID=940139 RepID=A0ABW9KHH0_9BACT|nr:proton-conducting transporter membrane subunit [Terriglobus aquaticus]
MNWSHTLPALPVALPLVGAALLGALRKWLPRLATDVVSIAFAGGTLTACLLLLASALHHPIVYWLCNWYPRGSMVLGIALVAEPIGVSLAALAAFLTLLALVFSWRSIDSGANHMQPLLLIFLAAMCGFSLTADLFNLFVFYELMSTAAFALCGLKTAEPAPLQGSFNFAVTNTIAAFMVLTGIALLYSITGALNMAQIGLALGTRHDPVVLFAFTLLTCGFLTKAAIVPFHLWLPDAHAVAPTPVCVLFSGIMVELGLYAVARLHIVLFAGSLASHERATQMLLVGAAAITILVGGVMCYGEHHLKRMLAFSTISHAGLMLLALAMGGPLALTAFFTYLLGHALIKASLFFGSGILLRKGRAIGERELFGAGRSLPFAALLWFAGGAGLAAAPGFLTSLGEAAATAAGEDRAVPGVTLLFALGGLLTAAAVFRVGLHVFLGWGSEPLTDQAADVGELPEDIDSHVTWYHLAAPALCVVAAIFLTVWSGWRPTLDAAAGQMAEQPAYLHTVYTRAAGTAQLMHNHPHVGEAAVHGALTLLCALLLACTSVFRLRLPRALRIGAFAESGVPLLREWQSGHPGDYVFWLINGVVLFGALALLLLR